MDSWFFCFGLKIIQLFLVVPNASIISMKLKPYIVPLLTAAAMLIYMGLACLDIKLGHPYLSTLYVIVAGYTAFLAGMRQEEQKQQLKRNTIDSFVKKHIDR